MKNGKKPTLAQKKLIKSKGGAPENWLVVKDTSQYMEVVSRMELKKVGLKRIRTRKLYKDS